ncbi:D-alanyl-D-alanine carboxypeptidase [Streptomyces sp. enrichment culture]|uniref:D-alanyl-D-alanine carboxypeptidase n=1 Tax=Streptomyces sp. enrichment culture TaxID=1795815 RepID=UPI003F57017E
MAGESPDRSKQRESSAEPTSGSAGPVPGARSESADPRLAMAREAKGSSGRGSVDTATRVLSARTAEEPGDAERGESAESPKSAKSAEATGEDSGESSAESSTEASGSGERGEGDSGGTDGRLRNAVAAWVASADGDEKRADAGEDSPRKTDTDTDEQDTEGAAASDADAGTDAESDAEPGDGDGGDKDAQDLRDTEGAEQGKAAQAPADAPEEPSDAREDAQEAAGAASKGSRDQDEAEEAEKPEADRSATADDSTDGDKTEPTAADADAKASGTSPAAAADGKTSGTGSAPAADRADGKPAVTPATTPDGDGKTSGTRPAPAADRTDGKAAKAEAAAPGGDAKAAPADSKTSNKSSAAAADGTDAEAPADSAGSKSNGTGSAPAAGRADGKATTAEAAGGAAGGKTSPARAAGGEADKAEVGGGSGGGETGGEAVDQPTAVFKAVRPPVDQPTTMLKLGGATKDAGEKDAERTSKFVALKPLDDPASRKPAPPAEATAPVPTVGPERTTQQPLPPKPPLDLLAELTNTPPPPDTPLRTAVRRVKIWTPLVLLLVIVFAVVQSVRPLPTPTLELTAKDSHTFEGGQVDIPWPAKGQAALDVQGIGTFGSSGEQKPVPIASVAKVMTAYVILRDHPLKSGADGPKIDIDQAAEDQSDAGQESTVDVTKGDKISQREALESILIASANNVARLLARWDAGSEKAFVQKMNDAAKDLGMKNTTYTDPSGLNNTTVSTAVDQVKLAKAAMQQPAFREVAAMMSYVDYKGTKHDNWNRLVGSNDVTGIKTGTTTSALGNLVFSAKKDVNGETHRIIGAVVRQPAGGPDNTILGAALYEGDRLIRAAQGALESATILKKGTVVGYADDGLGGRTPVAVTEDVTAVGWAGLSVKLTFAADDLPHTAEAGTKVGTLTVGDGSSGAVKVPVALQEDLVEPGFGAKLTRIG